MTEMASGGDLDMHETLTEGEFLISVLKEKGIVDDMTIEAIRLQFAHITRHDTVTTESENKVRAVTAVTPHRPPWPSHP